MPTLILRTYKQPLNYMFFLNVLKWRLSNQLNFNYRKIRSTFAIDTNDDSFESLRSIILCEFLNEK